jgi:putative component of membrane protein insertase Oxa1/YidC/SpoIIIJ protein YidD
MKFFALGATRFYQRFLSPYKGFCCAYASITGHRSCSTLGYRAIRRFGVCHGICLLYKRLHNCGLAYRRHQLQVRQPASRALGHQGGFLDCGGCDVPAGCDMPSGCDMPGSCDFPCDVPSGCHLPHRPEICGDILSCGGGGDCDWRRRKKDKQ